MKVAVLCNSDSLVLPSIYHLKTQGLLAGVAIPARSKAFLYQQLLQAGLCHDEITLIPSQGRTGALEGWVKTTGASAVLVFAFPWKVPAEVLELPQNGFFNFHFGLLPTYQGADPVFWQLKNREEKGGFVIHRMTEDIDKGPLVWVEECSMIPGENYGIYCQRMGMLAMNVLGSFLDKLENKTLVEKKQALSPAVFFNKPSQTDLSINWQIQSSEEIEWLVNAANPKYGGASTTIRNMEVRLLEVAPADVNNNQQTYEPGTIVYADALYGLIVACKENKFLKINIAQMKEGYVSGSKLFSLGVKTGEKFITKY